GGAGGAGLDRRGQGARLTDRAPRLIRIRPLPSCPAPAISDRFPEPHTDTMARILVTSALPYINGVKHLGNLAGSMLPADVRVRCKRAQGHQLLGVGATDGHGPPAELAAAAAGRDVQSCCDEQYEVRRAAGEAFNLSCDVFGRSSNAPNHRLTQHFA